MHGNTLSIGYQRFLRIISINPAPKHTHTHTLTNTHICKSHTWLQLPEASQCPSSIVFLYIVLLLLHSSAKTSCLPSLPLPSILPHSHLVSPSASLSSITSPLCFFHHSHPLQRPLSDPCCLLPHLIHCTSTDTHTYVCVCTDVCVHHSISSHLLPVYICWLMAVRWSKCLSELVYWFSLDHCGLRLWAESWEQGAVQTRQYTHVDGPNNKVKITACMLVHLFLDKVFVWLLRTGAVKAKLRGNSDPYVRA